MKWRRIDSELPFETRLRYFLYDNFVYVIIVIMVMSFGSVLLAFKAVSSARSASEEIYRIADKALTYVVLATPDGRVYTAERVPYEGNALANYLATVVENLIMSYADLTLGYRDVSMESWRESLKYKKLLPFLSESGQRDVENIVEGYYFPLAREGNFPANVSVISFSVEDFQKLDRNVFETIVRYDVAGTFSIGERRVEERRGGVVIYVRYRLDPEVAGSSALNLVGIQIDAVRINEYALR